MIDGHDRDGTARDHNASAVWSSRNDLKKSTVQQQSHHRCKAKITCLLHLKSSPHHLFSIAKIMIIVNHYCQIIKIDWKFCQKLNELIHSLPRDQKATASVCACATPQTPEVFWSSLNWRCRWNQVDVTARNWVADKRKPYVPVPYSLRRPCRSPNCASNGFGCVWKYAQKSHGWSSMLVSSIATVGSFGQSQVGLEFLGHCRTPRTSMQGPPNFPPN